MHDMMKKKKGTGEFLYGIKDGKNYYWCRSRKWKH